MELKKISSFISLLIFSVISYSQISNIEINFNDGLLPINWVESADSDLTWQIDSSVYSEGGFSLKSGNIIGSQKSSIEWTETFDSGTISFVYKTDTENCCDHFRFFIDDQPVAIFSGNNDWQEFRYSLTAGNHTLRWSYSKDGSVNTNTDSVWIDLVRFGEALPVPNPLQTVEGAFVFSTQTGMSEYQFENDLLISNNNEQTKESIIDIDFNNRLFFYKSQNQKLYSYDAETDSAITLVENLNSQDIAIIGTKIIAPKQENCGGYDLIFIDSGNVFSSNNECENRWDSVNSTSNGLVSVHGVEFKKRVYNSPNTVVNSGTTNQYNLNDLIIGPENNYWGLSNNLILKFNNSLTLVAQYQLDFTLNKISIREDGLLAGTTSSGLYFFQPEYNYEKFISYNSYYKSGDFVPGIIVDEDNDMLPLWWEIAYGLNPNLSSDATEDMDLDGRTNLQEFQDKTLPNNNDTDADGLTDGEENNLGTDPLNPDSDSDGLTDGIEVIDLSSNPLLSDTDSDGIDDLIEFIAGLDPNISNIGMDSDGDRILDIDEINIGTAPMIADSDADGVDDGDELDLGTNPLEVDSDNDGLIDGDELVNNSNPLYHDSDGDGLNDGLEVHTIGSSPISTDTDLDLMPDAWEYIYSLNLLIDDTQDDPDFDTVTNIEEYNLHGNPIDTDTDNDTLLDGEERDIGSALNSVDTDNDRMPDAWERLYGFDLLIANGDVDFDHDNYNNALEYWNKTNPIDSGSYPIATIWSTHQSNSNHNGYQPLLMDYVNVNPILELQIDDPDYSHGLNPAILIQNKLILSYPNNLVAYNAISGEELWRKYRQAHSTNPPAYSDNSIYIQTGNHGGDTFLWSYDVSTGDVNFQSPHGAQWESYLAPTIHGDSVYINGGHYGGAYSFNKITGVEQWFNGDFSQFDKWTPAVDNTSIYGYTNGRLTVVNKYSGILEYEIDDPSYGWSGYDVGIAPILGGFDTLIVSKENSHITVFDLLNKEVLWSFTFQITGQVSAANGVIYAKSSSGIVYAFDEVDGDIIWTWDPQNINGLFGNIVVTNQHLIVSDENSSYFLNIETLNIDFDVPASGEKVLTNSGKLVITNSLGLVSIFEVSAPDFIFSNSFE